MMYLNMSLTIFYWRVYLFLVHLFDQVLIMNEHFV